MASDARSRDASKKTPPSIELGWDPLILAPDGTYSTTIRITLRGWWEGGRPKSAELSIQESGGSEHGIGLQLQETLTTYPRQGLKAGHHYEVKVVVGSESTAKLMVVPTPPKPKTAEELALERDKLELERTKISTELEKLRKRPDSNEKKLADARLRRELAQIEQELAQFSQMRRATAWEIKVGGEDGKQTIRVAVFNDAEQPVPDWPVEITGAGIDPPIQRTDPDGIVRFAVNFTERSREVRLFLHGTPKDHRLVLDGPIRDVSNKPFYWWGLANVILLVVGLTVVGFNPSSWEVKLTAPPGEISQRYRNEYRFGQFKTDAELDHEGIKVERPQPKTISNFVKWYWRGFWFSVFGTIVCFFVVFRDDARRSWRRAKQRIARKYGVGEVDIKEGRASLGETLGAIKQGQQGGQPSATPTGGQTPLTSQQFWRVYPLMELGISFLSDMVSNAVFQRKSA